MSEAITVTIWASGDNENTPADAVHHGLEYARKAGFIESWGDPIQTEAARSFDTSAVEKVLLIAEDVVWYDWSNNDSDAVHTMEQLRLALAALSRCHRGEGED